MRDYLTPVLAVVAVLACLCAFISTDSAFNTVAFIVLFIVSALAWLARFLRCITK